MRSVIVAAFLLATAFVAPGCALQAQKSPEIGVSGPAFTRGWENMFDAPYQGLPGEMMAISCVEDNTCYLAAGSNGVGFGVMRWDGNIRQNKNFEMLTEPKRSMMILGIAVGGTKAVPHGASGGMGLEDGIEYFVNSTEILPSEHQPFMITTQDVRQYSKGMRVMVVGSDISGKTQDQSVFISTDGGKIVSQAIINTQLPLQSTTSRYGAYGSENTFYVTLGGWPQNNNEKVHPRTVQKSARIAHVWDPETKKYTRVNKKFVVPQPKLAGAAVGNTPGYSSVVAKTTDGGKTWTNLLSSTDNYYPNGIDCASENHCIFVGEGMDDKAGGHIFLTTDGTNFKEVLFLPSGAAGQYSLMSVRFASATEAWVAGSFAKSQFEAKTIFLHTMDGGKTWAKDTSATFEQIDDVMDMTFNTNGVGFATAITAYSDATILRYDATGPAPTPAPTWHGNFTQTDCTDEHCALGCKTGSYRQNECLPLNGGGSALAVCQGNVLMQNVFPISKTCTGLKEEQPTPLNTCLLASGGGSFKTMCGPN